MNKAHLIILQQEKAAGFLDVQDIADQIDRSHNYVYESISLDNDKDLRFSEGLYISRFLAGMKRYRLSRMAVPADHQIVETDPTIPGDPSVDVILADLVEIMGRIRSAEKQRDNDAMRDAISRMDRIKTRLQNKANGL